MFRVLIISVFMIAQSYSFVNAGEITLKTIVPSGGTATTVHCKQIATDSFISFSVKSGSPYFVPESSLSVSVKAGEYYRVEVWGNAYGNYNTTNYMICVTDGSATEIMRSTPCLPRRLEAGEYISTTLANSSIFRAEADCTVTFQLQFFFFGSGLKSTVYIRNSWISAEKILTEVHS